MTSDPLLPVPLLVAAVGFVALWGAIAVWTSPDRARGVVLALLRLACALVLAAAFLRPGTSRPPPKLPKPVSGVVLVGSEIQNAPAFIRSRAALDRFRVLQLGTTSGENRESLKEALVLCGGAPAGALILVADEDDMERAATSAARLTRNGATVSTVAPRRPSRPSLSLEAFRTAPSEPRARTMAVAVAELHSRSTHGIPLQVRWILDGLPLETQDRILPAGTTVIRLEHAFVVPEAGLHRLSLHAVGVASATAGAFFRAASGAQRALVIEGDPRPVYRSLRRALEDDETFLVRASSTMERAGGYSALPRAAAEWSGIDLVVLGDLHAAELPPSLASAIVEFVLGGGGLVIVAGRNNLGRGQWQDSPLERIIPLDMSESTTDMAGPFDIRPAGRVGMPRPFPFGTLWSGLNARVDIEGAASWRDLAELPSVYETAGLAKGASVPIVATRPGRSVPFLVSSTAGRGRVAVLMSSDVWRWRHGNTAMRIAHDHFWRDLFAGVARIPSDGGPGLWLEASSPRATVSQEIRMVVHVTDPSSVVHMDIVTHEEDGSSERRSIPLASGAFTRTASLRFNRPGSVGLRAELRSVAGVRRSPPLELAVVEDSRDAEGPRDAVNLQYRHALEVACLQSGGTVSEPDNPGQAVAAFLRALEGADEPVARRAKPATLLSPLLMLAAFLTLLVTEWSLSRSWSQS
jgi:hypothetical protein